MHMKVSSRWAWSTIRCGTNCSQPNAARGRSLNGRSLRVSKVTELQRSLLVTGFPYDAWSNPRNNLEYYGRFAKLTQGVRRLGSAALDLSYVAAGRVEGYWELSIKPWDVAAGGLIASEAGATVTNMAGQADYVTPPCSLLAAPPGLHAKMKAVLDEKDVRILSICNKLNIPKMRFFIILDSLSDRRI